MISSFLLPVILLQVSFSGLDEAVRAVERQEAIQGRVSAQLAQEAVEAIRYGAEPALLEPLLTIAGQGPQAPLVEALMELALQDTPSASLALELLARRRASRGWREALQAPADRWEPALSEWLYGADDALAEAAGALLVLVLSPEGLVAALGTLVEQDRLDRACALLELAGSDLARPGEAFRIFLEADVHDGLAETFSDTMARFVERDERSAALALERASYGAWGPGHAVLRSLGKVPPQCWEQAQGFVRASLLEIGGGDDVMLVRNAILAAGELLLPELVPLLPGLALNGPGVAIRRAALVSMGHVCYRDAATIDLLIDLLDEPDVASEAYSTLLKKAGVQLPMRVETWSSWRQGQRLPDKAPLPDAERLAAQRAVRALLAARERDQEGR